jgi:hypothetical protein
MACAAQLDILFLSCPWGNLVIQAGMAVPPIGTSARGGAHLLVFRGSLLDGRPFVVMQHCSQVSVCFMASPKMKDEPRRIGFGT